MRYSFYISIVGLLLATAAGCSDNKNNNQTAKSVNLLNEDIAPPPLAKPNQITAETRFAAGQFAETQGNPDRAVMQYGEALKLNSKHEPSLFRLGVLLTQAKQYPRAIEVWKQYISVTKGSAVAYSNAAFCYELAGQTPQAEDCYKKGIKKEPTNQPCRVNYGLMLARLGRMKEATDQLSAVLKPAEVHYNLASVHEQMGRKEDAKSEYDRALQLDPQLWEAQARLSKLE